ncbi:uncharacterized protein LOC142337658 [Convolutriloba macropyga]|uniref:uncharacterized protein LOC142337658 n=1 Tax=Convolutriloba macropyga TaxID=536237 RepID=UPI003F51E39A
MEGDVCESADAEIDVPCGAVAGHDDTEHSSTSIDTEQPGPSESLKPLRNWHETFSVIIGSCKVDDDAKEWILSHFDHWDSLEALNDSEDLTPKKLKIVEKAMMNDFLDFSAQRQVFIRFLCSWGVSIEQESALIDRFSRGCKSLCGYVDSGELLSQYTPEDCVKIRAALSSVGFLVSEVDDSEDGVNTALGELEDVLRGHSLHAEAIDEVLLKIQQFDDLKTGLESCEELSKREIKDLTEKLKEIFVKIKVSKYNKNPQLKTVASFLESLSLPAEAVEWILKWLSSHDIPNLKLDDLDQCEDLSKRQCKAVKEKLRDVYQVDEAKQTEDRPACEVFLEQVEIVLKNRPDIQAASTWILENVCSFQSLDDLEINEDLSKKQILYLKSELKKHFNVFRLQEVGPAAIDLERCSTPETVFYDAPSTSTRIDQMNNDEDLQFENVQEIIDEQSAFSIIQLISSTKEIQDGYAVDKFLLSEEGVEALCKLVPETSTDELPVFYNSISHGMIIDFERLNQVELKCIGLFGPNDAILQALEPIVPVEDMQSFSDCFNELCPGIYLIGFRKCELKFVVFRSENEDFECVKKDSRSVHFLRYMSQLTRNVVICVSEKYENRLAFEEKEIPRSNRRACYALKKHELQQESFKFLDLDSMIRNLDIEYQWNFSSTASGLLGTVCRQTLGSSKPKFEGRPADVYELKQLLQVSEINDLKDICHQFKLRYLETFYPEVYESIEEKAEKHMAQLQILKDDAVREIVLFSTAMYFIESETHFVFNVVKSFYVNNPLITNNMWNERAGFDHFSIDNVLRVTDAQFVRGRCKENVEARHSIGKYMLWTALSELEGGKPAIMEEKGFHQITWLELDKLTRNCQKWKKLFGQAIVQNVMLKVSSSIDYKCVDELLEYSVTTFVQYISGIIEPHTNTSLFRAFCRQHQRKGKEKHRERELTRLAVEKFDETMRTRERAPDDYSGTQKKLKNIRQGKKKAEKEFSYFLETTEEEVVKNIIQIYQLTPSKDELTIGENDLEVSKLEWLKVGELDCLTQTVVHAVYVMDSSKVVVIFNEEARSKAKIFNLTDTREAIISMPIGKVVSESLFDSKSRVLAFHSCMEFGVIHFLRFNEDYIAANKLKELDLINLFGLDDDNFPFCLQPNSSYLWFFSDGRLRKMDYKKSTLVKNVNINTDDIYLTLKCTPDGGCLLGITRNGQCFPVMTETGNVLGVIEGVSPEIHLTSICNQMISFVQNDELSFKIAKIEVTGAQHEMKLTKKAMNKMPGTVSQDHQANSHWIDYIYWMYTKFPCKDLLLARNQGINFWFLNLAKNDALRRKLISGVTSLFSKLHLTHKPIDNLAIHTEKIFKSLTEMPSVNATGILIKLGDFLRQLITFVPIQIARCRANVFHILEKGYSLSLDSVSTAFDLTDKINLGFYESIFNAWKGDVKVISSMGKQSSGKSYTLNHLTGSSFNIAGTRCTDGCWMTVKEQDDCLYVILDFEGLGSIERTEQEDMLLSLFNSAISTITIFKTEKRLDREVEKLFNKMNLGSDQLKGNGQVFRGKFVIVINDVAEQDVEETPKEFEQKINSIVSKSDNNFIKKLYDGNFEIQAFPAFESSDYYENIACLLHTIKNEITPMFQGGTQFAGSLKLLMAKLAVNDFAPLDRQQIDERVRFLKAHLEHAVYFGQTSDEDPKRRELDLKSLDNPSILIPLTKNVNLSSVGSVVLNDFDIIFTENQLFDFLTHFLKIIDITPDNFHAWRCDLVEHLQESIKFRFERVRFWLETNLKKWGAIGNQEYNDIIKGIMERLETKEFNFQQKFKFCDEKCELCFLKCSQITNHKEAHECCTLHKCTSSCSFCDSAKETNKCKLPFGHNGEHLCAEINHLCGKPCRYQELNGCEAECQKMNGHDDEHQCSEKRHPCVETCSLPTCNGRCIINCEEEHLIHKFSREQCICKCSVDSCPNKCAALDHFHGTDISKIFRMEQKLSDELPFVVDNKGTRIDCDEHFCGQEHHCEHNCTKNGFCQVWTEKQLKDEVFTGARDTFTYGLQFAEKGQKLTCRQKIKPFMRTHDGPHVCSNEMHFCMVMCPTCENICDKPVDHVECGDVLHHVRHGNMRNCFFAANEDDIQVGSHKYKVGEPAVAEMCHVFCKTLGRGHAHIVECNNLPGHCYYTTREDGRRHETAKYHPNPEVPKDEMTHEAYWAMIGFQDPCQDIDVEEFQKCPAVCPSETHVDDQEEVFCDLPVLHNPIKTPADVGRSRGFVTKDGHLFACNHPTRFYHFVLCLDDSGSMHGPPWWSLVRAVQKFVRQRVQTSSNDKISIIIHSDRSRIVAEFIAISEFSKGLLKYKGGGNDFSAALQDADDLIGNHLNRNVIPVLIFMSDGNCRNGEVEMGEICNKYKWHHRLQIYTLGFGRIRFDKLRELARVGRGEFVEAVNAMQLNAAFVDISAKHPATIGVVV